MSRESATEQDAVALSGAAAQDAVVLSGAAAQDAVALSGAAGKDAVVLSGGAGQDAVARPSAAPVDGIGGHTSGVRTRTAVPEATLRRPRPASSFNMDELLALSRFATLEVPGDEWLVVIDPQHVFASPDISPWGSAAFAATWPRIRELAGRYEGRVIVTRWLPTAPRDGSWGAYFAQWPFADVDPADPLFDLVPGAAELTEHPVLDAPTFGKWGPALQAATGGARQLMLAGVSTDCCVISTALAAADAGQFVRVARDACAESTPENGAAALHVMGLYSPMITVIE